MTFFSLFLICCESKKSNISSYIGTYKIDQVSDSIILTSATLKILANHKYEYLGKDLEFNKNFFSNGNWKIENDTLILKTDVNKSCYFVKDFLTFQCENFAEKESNIVIKPFYSPKLTIKDCIPIDSSKFYTNLNEEKFYLLSGKLEYQKRKYDCTKYLPKIRLKIAKQK